MDGGCPYCGGQGCEQCGGGGGIFGHGRHGDGTFLANGLLGDIFGCIAPYPDGGCAAVRWYDFAVDYMMLKRDNTGRSQPFTSLGITGPIVLSTNNLDFGSYKPGFRFSAAYQIGPANSVEFTYFGQFNYTSSATVRSPGNPGNLFSTFTNFGIVGFQQAFSEFSQANFQQINYQSTFDSFEANWRNRWMAPNCRYQVSWTLGVREFILDEKFSYASASNANGFPGAVQLHVPARGLATTITTNDLTGLQIGTDLWVCLLPGLRVGGELQAGVYGNHGNVTNRISSNLTTAAFGPEKVTDTQVAFIGQTNLLATYRLNYQWTIRTGYQFLFVDGVALAAENFNPRPPINDPFRPRAKFINMNGDVFYHGWNVGLEYMW